MVTLPSKIQAGLTLSELFQCTAHPAQDGWTATVLLRGLGDPIDLETTPEGNGHRLDASAATTAGWAPGDYRVVVRMTRGGEVRQVYDGRLIIEPDVAGLSGVDPRTDNEIALAAIKATIANRASKDQLKMSFGGRSLEKTPLADLISLESRFIKKVRSERRRRLGKPLIQTIKVRMP